jgi:hypothetical protein
LNCKIDQLSVNTVNNSSPLPCSLCGGIDHLVINYGVSNEGSFEKVNIISQGNFSSNNNLYSNTCNSGWRNHLFFCGDKTTSRPKVIKITKETQTLIDKTKDMVLLYN